MMPHCIRLIIKKYSLFGNKQQVMLRCQMVTTIKQQCVIRCLATVDNMLLQLSNVIFSLRLSKYKHIEIQSISESLYELLISAILAARLYTNCYATQM